VEGPAARGSSARVVPDGPVSTIPAAAPGDLDPILDSRWTDLGDAPREIDAWVDYWTGRGRAEFRLFLERMASWESLVDAELERQGLPISLRFLPVIESGYTPTAVSGASAVGMWQFMAPTARGFGMEVTRLVDERRDPWVATPMAIRFLGDLHRRFGGSWHLALAAYNAGPGRVEGVLRRHAAGVPPSDSLYWALRDRLPRETRGFVPKFIAAARIGSDPAGHGITGIEPHAVPAFDEVTVPDATSLDVVARLAGADQRAVEQLNPQLVRGLTPAGVTARIRVPAGSGSRFAAGYEMLPPAERVTFVEHRVANGETFTHVARRYGVRVADIRAANPRVDPRRVQIGQRLVVPTAPSARMALASQSGSTGPGAGEERAEGDDASVPVRPAGATRAVVHQVSDGESLWTIARRYGATVAEVRNWNRIGESDVIHPGDELVLQTAIGVEYVVRSGDTLSGIADRFGVGTSELARVNGLSLTEVIRPGDRVRIPPPGE
jgi:membrane-bound lytic murein transglycosylase D